MQTAFAEHINQIKEVNPEKHRFLLAISGGLDSMVMWDLFEKCSLKIGIAHCNFRLRGAASEADAEMVQSLAAEKRLPFYSKSFDTARLAEQQKLSIQEMARKLRYDWLTSVQSKENYHWVVTAHHLQDSLETVLYNFAKGTGIRGLVGIPEINGSILRPLLPFSRKQLEDYQQSHSIRFREDASNREDKYQRNKIRHHILPVLEEINPGIYPTVARNLRVLKEVQWLYEQQLAHWKQKIYHEDASGTSIRFRPVLESPAAKTILFEMLRDFGFSNQQVSQLVDSLRSKVHSGALFASSGYNLLVDRDRLVIQAKTQSAVTVLELTKNIRQFSLEGQSYSLVYLNEAPAEIEKSAEIAQLDADKLVFPLRVRHWKAGDVFCPLGMKGKHKKLQDLFTDRKLDRFSKDKVLILENGDGRICWVIGLQMDDRFKISKSTKAHFRIERD